MCVTAIRVTSGHAAPPLERFTAHIPNLLITRYIRAFFLTGNAVNRTLCKPYCEKDLLKWLQLNVKKSSSQTPGINFGKNF